MDNNKEMNIRMLKKNIRALYAIVIVAVFIFGTFSQYGIVNAQIAHGGGTNAVFTNSATSVGLTIVTLNGGTTTSGSDYIWRVEFDYGTTTSYGSVIQTSVYYGSNTSYTYSNNITGLSCGTTYHYRALAEFSGSTRWGSDATFTTLSCSAAAATNAATSITRNGATLNGSVDAGMFAINQIRFDYGSTSSFGSTVTNSVSYGAGSVGNNFSYAITGLSCGSTYYFKASVVDTVGTVTNSSYTTFTTSACPTAPTVATVDKSVSASSVNLSGSISSQGGAAVTEGGFQYGPTTSYGATSTHAGSFTIPGNFNQSVSGLLCETTYNFRAYAFNGSYGFGANQTFTTGACVGSNGNLSGYIWSSNVGWISLNCKQGSTSGTSVCGTSAYSVNVIPNSATQTGLFSGYGWSSNIGWVSFNATDVSSCGVGISGAPNPGAQALVNLSSGTSTSGQVLGWAKVLAGDPTVGWDGCISLRGSGYGVTYIATSTTNSLAGSASAPSYAWGGNVVGWLSFANANLAFPTPTINLTVSSPTLTSAGGPVTLRWTTANLSTSNCTATSSDGLWSGPVSSGGGSALITIPANTSTSSSVHTYTLSGCTSIIGAAVNATSTTVTLAPGAGSTAPSVVFYANNIATSSSTPLAISSGDAVILTWQLQNIAQDSCIATSSGSYSGWSSTGKAPLSANSQPSVGTTPVTYSEIIPEGTITSSRTYTLTCTGYAAQTVYITTTPRVGTPSVSLTVNGAASKAFGTSAAGPVTLAWETANLDSSDCTQTGDWSGSVTATSSSVTLTVPANGTSSMVTKTYTLGCTAANGLPVTAFVTVTVPGSTAALSFLANGETALHISSGSAVTLTWQVQNIAANACRGTSSGSYSGWSNTVKLPSSAIGSTATSVTEIVGADGTITANRTYTMTCGSLAAQTVSIIVDDSAGSATLILNGDADTRTIDLPSSGGTINLRWTTSNLDPIDCNAISSDGTSSWSGSKSYSGGTIGSFTVASNSSTTTPAVHTYSLEDCYVAGVRLAPSIVVVNVLPSGVPYLSFVASTATASSSNLTVTSSDTVSLVWKIQNMVANSCRGANDNSYSGWNAAGTAKSSASSGTYTESIGTVSSSRSFTMTCTGTNGTVVYETATINVNTGGTGAGSITEDTGIAVNGEYPVFAMASSGGSATLVWTTSRVTSTNCTAESSAGDWTGAVSSAGGSQAITMGSNSSTTVAVSRTYTLRGCVGSYTGSVLPTKTVTVTLAPASTPLLVSFTANGVSSETPITISAGSVLTLSWQVQNVSANSCSGTSSGSYSGWNSTTKLPNTSVTTAQTFYDYLGSDGSIGDSRTYTLNCGSAGTKTVTINVAPPIPPPCIGLTCGVIAPPSINAIHRPPWMEI